MKKVTPMPIIGLTGGIGMGKSTVARMGKRYGIFVYNADHAVHELLSKGGQAVRAVAKLYPASYYEGAIHRKKLAELVFKQPKDLVRLERILHPLVRKQERLFIEHARRMRAKAALLDIPLLFETGGEDRCTFTICVSASKAVQKSRVLKRRGMTAAKFQAILARQMLNSERKRRADYVIDTGHDMTTTKKQFEKILQTREIWVPTASKRKAKRL